MVSITDRNFALVLGTSRSMVKDLSHRIVPYTCVSNVKFKIRNSKESLQQCKYTHVCIVIVEIVHLYFHLCVSARKLQIASWQVQLHMHV